MKIDYCILSCDDTPMYKDFWPYVSKVWKLRFNVHPVLIYIGNTPPVSEYGEVIVQSPIQDLSHDARSLPSLWARYFYTSKFPDKICIISDIDMFPISRHYFVDQLEPLSDETYAHLYPIKGRIIPTMYHVARGDIFKKYLKLPETFEGSMQQILDFGVNIKDAYNQDGSYWYVDEAYATHLLKNEPVHYIERKQYARLDRADWVYNEQTEIDILNNKYIDSHVARPYQQYKNDIDRLIKLITTPQI